MKQKALKLSAYAQDGFPLVARVCEAHGDFELHSHADFQELTVVTAGSGLHKTGSSSYRISAGDVFVISGDESHCYEETEGLQLVNVLFDFKKLGLPLQDLRAMPGYLMLFELEPKLRASHKFQSRLRLSLRELKEIEELLQRLAEEGEALRPGGKALCCGLFLELVARLSRISPERPSPEREELTGLSDVLKWMEEASSSKITLSALARRARMSKRNFQRVFKAATGTSPIKRLLEIRLGKAEREILEKPSLKLGEIALRNGFYDGNYLSRRFAKARGLAPSKTRKPAKSGRKDA